VIAFVFDVIASEFKRFGHKFDVIVNGVRKYSPNARKLKTKDEK
jgi:hypothetical protein